VCVRGTFHYAAREEISMITNVIQKGGEEEGEKIMAMAKLLRSQIVESGIHSSALLG